MKKSQSFPLREGTRLANVPHLNKELPIRENRVWSLLSRRKKRLINLMANSLVIKEKSINI